MPKLFDLGAHIEIISNQQHMELWKSIFANLLYTRFLQEIEKNAFGVLSNHRHAWEEKKNKGNDNSSSNIV